jgi:dihydroxyacetone kinase
MSIFFTAAGQKLHDGQPLPEALLSGLAQMKQYGGADLGDRTLIDALQPALEALQKGDLKAAAQAAQAGADATAKMVKAGAGRSSYVNKENLDGVTDPGAVAVAEVFKPLKQNGNNRYRLRPLPVGEGWGEASGRHPALSHQKSAFNTTR